MVKYIRTLNDDFLNDDVFMNLTGYQHGVLHLLQLLSQKRPGGLLPYNPKQLARASNLSEKPFATALDELIKQGLCILCTNDKQIYCKHIREYVIAAEREIQRYSSMGKLSAKRKKSTTVATNNNNNKNKKEKINTSSSSYIHTNPTTSKNHEEAAEDVLTVEEFAQMWNDFAGKHGFATVVKITDKRRKKFRERQKVDKHGKERRFWAEILHVVGLSSFLCGGGSNGWQANFDWLISNDDVIVGIMEGRYDNKVERWEECDDE